jgi:hypothetical protein
MFNLMLTEIEEDDREAAQLAFQSYLEQQQTVYDHLATILSGVPEFMLTHTEQLIYRSSPVHLRRQKNLGYWTLIHENLRDDYSTQSYYAHYRMRKASFERLVISLYEHPAFQLTAHNATPTYIQIACVIWRYANCHIGFRTAEATLGISFGSYHNFSERFQKALIDVYHSILDWPSTEEDFKKIKQGFECPNGELGRKKLPNVIGAIDGKLINIHRPKGNSEAFRDRKGNLSINLTAVCDDKCRFRYVYVGESGRCHDARVFSRSRIPTYMQNPDRYFPDGAYLLADSAYPLSRYLIIPYSQAESAADTTKADFNQMFSSMRQLIETAFGRMVSKWRFLSKYLYLLDSERVVRCVTCCLILHNFLIDMNEIDVQIDEEEEEEGGFSLTDPIQQENEEEGYALINNQSSSNAPRNNGRNANGEPLPRQLGLQFREELRVLVQTLKNTQ